MKLTTELLMEKLDQAGSDTYNLNTNCHSFLFQLIVIKSSTTTGLIFTTLTFRYIVLSLSLSVKLRQLLQKYCIIIIFSMSLKYIMHVRNTYRY